MRSTTTRSTGSSRRTRARDGDRQRRDRSHDTGIYIGQSHDVRVTHNFAMGNVSGFELENCRDTRMDHNDRPATRVASSPSPTSSST